MTELYYNNSLILSGQPTPFVGKEDSMIRYGERWGVKSDINLRGQITGCTYADLIYQQNNLIKNLSKDFQSFQIVEDSNTVVDKPYCIVKSIQFNDSSYSYILDYQVKIECYEQNLFSGTYGVLDPNDEWQFEEGEDGLVNITHVISARGFNTSAGNSNALNNAKVFVHARTGLNDNISPYFTHSGSTFSPCLKSLAEKIDRFATNYSVTETYVSDKYFGTNGILRYTVDFNCNQEGIVRVSVQGNVDGCGMYSDISGIRSRYASFNPYTEAQTVYSFTTTTGVLNSIPTSSGVNEDIYTKKLTFNVNFDNTTGNAAYLEYGISINSGENGITTVSFDGQIKGRGNSKERWQNVKNYYTTLSPYLYALEAYTGFAGSVYPLNTKPLSSGVNYNQFNSEIGVNATWDNETLISGFSELSYTLNYTPALKKVAFTPLLNDCQKEYYVTDLGFVSRASFSIAGQGRLDCETPLDIAVSYAKQLGNQKFGSECPKTRAILEENQITTGTNTINFNFGWSAESKNQVSTGYTTIDNLLL